MAGFKLRWAGFVAMATLLLAPTRARGDDPGPGEIPSLFIDCDGPLPPTQGPNGKPWPARSRALLLTQPGIAVLEKLSANPELTAKLRVPGGRQGELVVDMRGTLTDPQSGARTWVGHMPSGDGGELVLASLPRTGAGSTPLRASGWEWYAALRSDSHGRFELQSLPGSDCFGFVRSIDEPARCGNVPPRSRRQRLDRERKPPKQFQPRELEPVDLLVITTPGAAQRCGSLSSLRVKVVAAVEGLNEALRNSGLRRTFRLVGCEPLGHPAPDPSQYDLEPILDELTVGQAEWAHEAHLLRDARGADIVCLLTGGTAADGWANQLMSLEGDPEGAYCAVHVAYAFGDLSLAHEIGHVLGCGHTIADTSACIFPYAHGYYFEVPSGSSAPASRYRTLMAQDDPTPGPPRRRVLHFSNPAVFYEGNPEAATGAADVADNARVLRATLSVVAGYRQHIPYP